MKTVCQNCPNIAVWWYMPSDGGGDYCDECVPRGCSCNVDPNTGVEDVDDRGRFYPCCEYGYAEEGIEEGKDWEEYAED
jgi:hypothetical protein